MLVLSRKAGEQINIGDDISIEVRRIAGNRVTIALHAPREVRILRAELQEAADAFPEEVPQEELQNKEVKGKIPSICAVEQTVEQTVKELFIGTLAPQAGA